MTKINIAPNSDQIRWFAQSAIHAWDLFPERARENVIADMTALLAYLDACDNGSGRVVLGIAKIERGIRLKISWGDLESVDLTDSYAEDRYASERSGDHQDRHNQGNASDTHG
jgi:hypothetical protein